MHLKRTDTWNRVGIPVCSKPHYEAIMVDNAELPSEAVKCLHTLTQ